MGQQNIFIIRFKKVVKLHSNIMKSWEEWIRIKCL